MGTHARQQHQSHVSFTERQRDRETETETETERQGETERERETERENRERQRVVGSVRWDAHNDMMHGSATAPLRMRNTTGATRR